MFLGDILALTGRLTDDPGFGTARQRFRRFLGAWPGTIDDVRALLDDAQRAGDEQAQRALMDLVVTLGRYLEFDVTYGCYERVRGAVRFDGVWRVPGEARLVLEVRTDRTRPFSPTDLERTIAALPAVPDGGIEQTRGLCIVVPQRGVRRPPGRPDEEAQRATIRTCPLEALLELAERVRDGVMTQAEVLQYLFEAPDVSTPVDGVPRALGAGGDAGQAPATAHLALVPREPPPDYWIATIPPDEQTTAEQLLDAVIRQRGVLGLGAIGVLPSDAHAGDWVCFFVRGRGVVGHARLGGRAGAPGGLVRGAERYVAVFTLTGVELYPTANPLDSSSPALRLADRTLFGSAGPFLSPISEADFRSLTACAHPRRAGHSTP